MAMYTVWEGSLENLYKKVRSIEKKCKKYNCPFTFKEVGEEFRDVYNNGIKYTVRYVNIECDGNAKINDWEFVSTIEHTENGNIFHKGNINIDIPARYRNCAPNCEHCNKIRDRKDTYIVHNTKTDEFKQIGKSCLREYTNGLSVEVATFFASLRDAFEEAYEVNFEGANFMSCGNYYNTEELVKFAVETVNKFGYVKSNEEGIVPTKVRALDFYRVSNGIEKFGPLVQRVTREIYDTNFNCEREEVVEEAKEIIEWAKNLDDTSDYFYNLKTVLGLKYVGQRSIGILVSAVPSFRREMNKIKAREAKIYEDKTSKWVGNIGEKVSFDTEKVEVITAWTNCYDGYNETLTYIYKFKDTDGNIYTWKTSKSLEEGSAKVSGTVKDHTDYKGIKQTVLTRCKVNHVDSKVNTVNKCKYEGSAQEGFDVFWKYVEGN